MAPELDLGWRKKCKSWFCISTGENVRENLNSSVQIPQAQWFIRSNSITIVKMNTTESKNSNGTETPSKKLLFLPPRVMFLDEKYAPWLHHEVRCRLVKLMLFNGRSDSSKAQRNTSPTKTWPTLIMHSYPPESPELARDSKETILARWWVTWALGNIQEEGNTFLFYCTRFANCLAYTIQRWTWRPSTRSLTVFRGCALVLWWFSEYLMFIWIRNWITKHLRQACK